MDLSGIFQNNIVIVYFFMCLGLFMHDKMRECQKIAILYLVSFVACILRIIPIVQMTVAVIVIQFIYSEYLSEDSMKTKIITKVRYKILDYIFQFFINYATWMFVIALVLCSNRIGNKAGKYKYILLMMAAVLIFLLIQYIVSKKFEIKSVDKIYNYFEKYPINFMPSSIQEEKFTILSNIEDKSFFERKNTYNIFSLEFLKYKLEQSLGKKAKKKDQIILLKSYIKKSKNIRGYSTIEMQLLRTIALESGYTCVIRRKIFEFFYSKIIFSSLKQYYRAHQVVNWWDFKKYIIWLYYQCVPINVNGKQYDSIKSFINIKSVENWPLEKMFVAILALSGKCVNEKTLEIYADTITEYDLNIAVIEYLASNKDVHICDFEIERESIIKIENKKDVEEILEGKIENIEKMKCKVVDDFVKITMYCSGKINLKEIREQLGHALQINSDKIITLSEEL